MLSKKTPRKPPIKKIKKDDPQLKEFVRLTKLLVTIKENENTHDSYLKTLPVCKNKNVFGSTLGIEAQMQHQLRYHLIAWRVAKRCVNRRINRLEKYL